jgi:nucleotide-binding universal stress UspA family protein
MTRVLVAVDDSLASMAALDAAVELVVGLPAELVVLSVAYSYDMAGDAPIADAASAAREDALASAHEAAERARSKGVCAREMTVEGPIAKSVAEAAETLDAKFIVVGDAHRSRIERLLRGSVARSLIGCSERTLMVVHPQPIAPGRTGGLSHSEAQGHSV